MKTSAITIVIPVYNRAHTLGRTLESIERQTMWPDEVILVDNNSTDDSMSVMKSWQKKMSASGLKVTVTSQPRQGAAAARNKGLSMVRSRYVMFFDSDDEMLPNHVEDFATTLASHPKAQIAGRSLEMHQLDGSVKTGYFKADDPLFHHIFRGTLSTLRIVTDCELVRDAGGWDESVAQWDDYELGIRYLMKSPEIITVPGPPSVIVHSQEQSLSGTSFSDKAGCWETALDKSRETLLTFGHSEAIPWLDTRYAILAAIYHNEGHPELARNLLDRILSVTPHPRRLRLLYHHNRIFRRFTWVVARVLFLW